MVNGESVTLAAPAQVVSGRTLVPLRFVGEAFGCDVNWVPDTKTAVVTLAGQVIEVPVGQNYVMINGEKSNTEVPGQLINGSTFVPLRLIGESLGAKLDYDPNTKAISILMNTYENKASNFRMVLPTGWTAETESETGVILKNGADGEAAVALMDTTVGVAPTGAALDTIFADYKSAEGYTASIDGNTALASYKAEGYMNYIYYIYSNTGVYAIAFDAPEASFTDEFAAQCNLMVNTLSDYE